MMEIKTDLKVIYRLISKIIVDLKTSCWNWTGALNDQDYAKVLENGKNRQAYRVSYEQFVGPIPEGLDIDHLCRNKKCINPKHLEPVTRKVNVERYLPHKRPLWDTHCANGHEYTKDNLYIRKGRYGNARTCKTCRRISANKMYIKRKLNLVEAIEED